MGFFDRLSAGWDLSMKSFSVLRKNKHLLIFPILSTLALLVVTVSFVAVMLLPGNWDIGSMMDENEYLNYALFFLFYLVNYFIIVFFNVALVHCVRIYFQGGVPTVNAGLSFAMSRINAIMGWAVIAATVGILLKALQENGGKLGEIVGALIGLVWSIVTFFVVPVIAYENAGPLKAVKRSTAIMKQKWGESLGASFSMGLVHLAGLILLVVPLFFLGYLISWPAAIVLGVAGLFILGCIVSTAETIFIAAIYHKINNEPAPDFNDSTLDGLFIKKESKGIFG
jgi:hypothetical protein